MGATIEDMGLFITYARSVLKFCAQKHIDFKPNLCWRDFYFASFNRKVNILSVTLLTSDIRLWLSGSGSGRSWVSSVIRRRRLLSAPLRRTEDRLTAETSARGHAKVGQRVRPHSLLFSCTTLEENGHDMMLAWGCSQLFLRSFVQKYFCRLNIDFMQTFLSFLFIAVPLGLSIFGLALLLIDWLTT